MAEESEPATPLRSVLHDWHASAGAKFGDFAGWSMPLEYAGGGVVAEHHAVRTGVGIFDVSHLGKIRVTGPDAVGFVNRCLSNDLGRIEHGHAQYTLCCTPEGGVVDDLIVYRFSDDDLFLIPNAANTAEVARLLEDAAPIGVQVRNVHRDYAVLAVQGPNSADTLAAMALPTDMPYFGFTRARWGETDLTVCRTGYTGEHGYELVVGVEDALDLWEVLIEAGEPWDVRAAGLGARDTLRTEMGYPLHGQDISRSISPLQARLGWAVGWRKPEFWGHESLREEKAAGASRLLVGLRHTGRRIPRPGMTVHDGDEQIGVVTSGTFGPSAGVGIGLALLDRGHTTPGAQVELDLRGKREPYEVVKPPFVTTDVDD